MEGIYVLLGNYMLTNPKNHFFGGGRSVNAEATAHFCHRGFVVGAVITISRFVESFLLPPSSRPFLFHNCPPKFNDLMYPFPANNLWRFAGSRFRF